MDTKVELHGDMLQEVYIYIKLGVKLLSYGTNTTQHLCRKKTKFLLENFCIS